MLDILSHINYITIFRTIEIYITYIEYKPRLYLAAE